MSLTGDEGGPSDEQPTGPASPRAGERLLRDALWARITGVVLVSFSAIANFMFIPYYPVWSIVLIAIDLFVMWALLSPRRV